MRIVIEFELRYPRFPKVTVRRRQIYATVAFLAILLTAANNANLWAPFIMGLVSPASVIDSSKNSGVQGGDPTKTRTQTQVLFSTTHITARTTVEYTLFSSQYKFKAVATVTVKERTATTITLTLFTIISHQTLPLTVTQKQTFMITSTRTVSLSLHVNKDTTVTTTLTSSQMPFLPFTTVTTTVTTTEGG